MSTYAHRQYRKSVWAYRRACFWCWLAVLAFFWWVWVPVLGLIL